MPQPILTLGHSTRAIEEFVGMLTEADVELLVDVRRLPGSRRHPQFDQDALQHSLRDAGIAYDRIAALTGRRPVSKEVPFQTNALWRNRSFHNYADHALSDEFRDGLAQLRARSAELATAIMCSEAVWWRCHRRIIADHLIAAGDDVVHLMGPGTRQKARMTPGAVLGRDGSVTYPATDPPPV